MSSLKMKKIKNDVSIVLCGAAGQGIKTIEFALTHIFKEIGLYVFSTKEYMSRIRGGCNSTEIRVSNDPVFAFVDRIDIFIPLTKESFAHLKNRITKNTLIIGLKENIPSGYKTLNLDLEKIALEVGANTYFNSIAIGFILGFLNINKKEHVTFFTRYFKNKGQAIIDKNIDAANKGYECSQGLAEKNHFALQSKSDSTQQKLFNGSEAIALGAIAGNCNFVPSYPMSPGTTVLSNLANYSQKYDILIEQVEDEIAAINMAQGAWYAGARALVTTAGGGFALMSEGMSLAGMTETPVVIHVGQRPGPATGLPTRTEQSDLNLALYAGHGEFPRIIFAPGSIEQAFSVTQKAFDLADKYQIPVIILADQLFLDSYYTTKSSEIKLVESRNYFIKTKKAYQRYQLTKDGVSPRGIPGYGNGLVYVDSDEHTEEGLITEDFNCRINMVKKRLKKLEYILKESITPEFFGYKNYKYLFVAWGSNYHVMKEALCHINDKDFAFLHFSQVYPLNKTVKKYFEAAKKIIVVENNATSQFAGLLKKELNITTDTSILKYNGLPFSVEEMTQAMINCK